MARASYLKKEEVVIEYGPRKTLTVTLAEAEAIAYALKDLFRDLNRVDI